MVRFLGVFENRSILLDTNGNIVANRSIGDLAVSLLLSFYF